MSTILKFKINQIFNFDPLLWLWLLLGVVGLIALGILLSWFFGKPVIKFYIDGDVKNIVSCKRNDKPSIPIELSEYIWYEDKTLTKKVNLSSKIKKRVTCLYSGSEKIIEGLK